ncbi:MAG: penicillin-binding protein 2, partial [Prevotellaceae bacterium]|nr:penicillin-binding protein 2 [Prevotellaceae bacterium]
MAIQVQKKNIILGSILLLSMVLILRLLFIQILDPTYPITAINNSIKYQVVYPARGLVFDRNGEVIVNNLISYDIMLTPSEMQEVDTTEFCRIFNISNELLSERLIDINKRRRQIGFQSVQIIKQASEEEYALFQEKFYKFPGFYGVSRTIRSYPRDLGGNLLGYIAEVDSIDLRRNSQYKRGDNIGRTGIEKSYEPFLKGKKGSNIYIRDAHNRTIKSYDNGIYDIKAIPGKDVISTIDANLQEFGEQLMANKVGSIVAIEPATGEILSMVSSPGIHVNQLANIGKYWGTLVSDPLKPMFNRAVMSSYPPGSVFKLINGLIGLQEGVITPDSRFGCNMGYQVGRGVGCHAHPTPTNLMQSIQMSCNAYYCNVYRAIMDNRKYKGISDAFLVWNDHVRSFGFGQKLGSDFPAEQSGNVPTTAYYDRFFGKSRWNFLTTISLAIGQGELGTTPLQLANLAAIIANRGYYITPHIVREISDTLFNQNTFTQRHYTSV